MILRKSDEAIASSASVVATAMTLQGLKKNLTRVVMHANDDNEAGSTCIVRAATLGTGFVDIFIGQIHSESDDQI